MLWAEIELLTGLSEFENVEYPRQMNHTHIERGRATEIPFSLEEN